MIAVRRLVAILVADVDGYSRLIGEDVAETAKAVRERLEAARPIVSNSRPHRQDDRRRRNAGVSFRCRSGRMRHRDPTLIVERQHRLIHGEDILGDGLNIAERLEGHWYRPILGFVLGPTSRKLRPASAAKNKDE